MKIGYARVSTTHQQHSLEAQIEKLETAGCEKIFSEEVSAVSSKQVARKKQAARKTQETS